MNYWNNFDGLPSKGNTWVAPIRYARMSLIAFGMSGDTQLFS